MFRRCVTSSGLQYLWFEDTMLIFLLEDYAVRMWCSKYYIEYLAYSNIINFSFYSRGAKYCLKSIEDTVCLEYCEFEFSTPLREYLSRYQGKCPTEIINNLIQLL